MADVLALVSKAVFEKAARDESLEPGSVWPTAAYASAVKALQPLAEGGRLFLVTVRPPDEALWLVGVLDQPAFDGTRWTAARPNAIAIRDISNLRRSLVFANGAGLPKEKGKLGMSLQTPRVLTAEDVRLLADATSRPTKAATAPRPRRKARPAPAQNERPAAAASAPPPDLDEAALLARWRKTRSPRLADLVCCAPNPALAEKLAKIKRANADPANRMIRGLPDDDPRVTVFLVEMLHKAKWPGSGAKKLWTNVFAKLIALKDKRAVEPLARMVTTPPYFLGAAFTKWCVEQIQVTGDKLAALKQPADDAETKRLADAQVATIPPEGWFHVPGTSSPGADALIAKVWAAPDDLELRSVVGDALLELGDPWGDLIALQTTAKQAHSEAVKKLINKHGARFAGPIAHVSHRASMRFERGFLSSCEVGKPMVGRRLWEEAAKAPHWATVREVSIGIWGETPKWWFASWLQTSPLTSLREIVIGSLVVGRASATAPWQFVKVAQRFDWRAEDMVAHLLRGMTVEQLQALVAPNLTPKLTQMIDDAIEDVS